LQNTRPTEFIALIAMLTAMVALSIDAMLPAIGAMATELGARDPNDRQLIIVLFFGGLALGTFVYGPISDSVGRKPVIFVGLALFVMGCLLAYFATSFNMLLAGRLLQGFGAAAPRVVSMAMVRDGAKGADMARIMSYVMSVFMLVPILAPAVGEGIVTIASWRMIFLGFIVFALVCGTWLAIRQGETLAVQNRRAFSVASLWSGAKEVVRHPVSIGYTVALIFVFGAFSMYLVTSQQIFAEQYKQGSYFILWFGGLSVGIAMSMIINGRYVKRFGMRRMSQVAMVGFVVVSVMMLLASLMWSGQPPLWMAGILFLFCLFFVTMTFGNFNAMAMEPMGHIAGMAAAISGGISALGSFIIGGLAARQYDGTLLPISVVFVVFGLLAWVVAEWAERRRPVKNSSL
jgi:MFS transporter, DHA1 family, multidrug resistance protein